MPLFGERLLDPTRVMAEVALRRNWRATECAIGWTQKTPLRRVMRKRYPLAAEFCYAQVPPSYSWPHEEIISAVEQAGSVSGAARLLGTTRDRLYSFCRRDLALYEQVRRPQGSRMITAVDEDAFVTKVAELGSMRAAAKALDIRSPNYVLDRDPELRRRVDSARRATTLKARRLAWPPEEELLRACLGRGVNAVAQSYGVSRDAVWDRLSGTSQKRYRAKRQSPALATEMGKPGSYVRALKLDPCSYCGGRDVGGLSQLDHIEPRDGSERDRDLENMTAACLPCNVRKRKTRLLRFLLDEGRR